MVTFWILVIKCKVEAPIYDELGPRLLSLTKTNEITKTRSEKTFSLTEIKIKTKKGKLTKTIMSVHKTN